MVIARIISIGILVIALISGCKRGGNEGMTAPTMKVNTALATTKKLKNQIYFTSKLSPISSVTIEPRVDGYLSECYIDSGKPVRRGDLLFRIDPSQIETDLYTAQANLESTKATLTQTHNNYQRATPLARINAISQSSLDEYRANYIAAQAAVKSAEQSLENAELNLSYTYITAPIEGLVANSPASRGDYVGPGTKFTTLTTITNIDTVTVDLPIPTARYMSYLEPTDNSFDNQEILSDITLILADSSNYPYVGKYDYTQQSVENNNASVVIVAKFPNPNLTLKGGMFARVRASIGNPTERVMIPQSAVTQTQGVSSVWVIKADSTATFRRLELGPTFGNEWQVNAGLASGERVATTGQLKLHEGAKISF